MGQELYCEFTVESKRKAVYWWPLLFEAMHWSSFDFTAPGLPKGRGYYYYTRLDNTMDSDFVEQSFRTVWDEISGETTKLLISFWYTGHDPFPLDVSIDLKPDADSVEILLSLSDAFLIDLPLEKMKERVARTLECALSIYGLCKPRTGKLYWEDTNAPWASFGHPLEDFPLSAHGLEGRKPEVIESALPDGNILYCFDPIPVRVRGGWDFISLRE
jgi:hypothetical protein